jgi:hypothetical protein
VDGLVDLQVRADRHERRRHDAARALLVEGEQLPDVARLFRLHVDEHVLGHGVRHRVDHVRRVVRIHRLEEIGRLVDSQGPQNRRRFMGIELGEQVRHLLVR